MKVSPTARKTSSLRLCDRIRQARLQAAMTKSELAKQAGVCLSAVVQWEHAQGTTPNAANLARVAQITDVAFEWLATGRGARRIAAADGPAAVHPVAMAHTLFEEQLLDIARTLPVRHHELMIDLLQLCIKKLK